MKKISCLIILIFCLISLNIYSQTSPPDPPDHSDGGGPVGGSAPIGSGVVMLIVMAGGYAGYKIRKLKKEDFG